MKKTTIAIAMELRDADKELRAKYDALPEATKCQWVIFACENPPWRSIERLRELVLTA